jgi:phospholipid transport system substrate-binding protein
MPSRRGDTAVEFWLRNNKGQWMVYDVTVDGVGLVSSYRSQLDSVLRNASFTELVDRLRSREASVKVEQGP